MNYYSRIRGQIFKTKTEAKQRIESSRRRNRLARMTKEEAGYRVWTRQRKARGAGEQRRHERMPNFKRINGKRFVLGTVHHSKKAAEKEAAYKRRSSYGVSYRVQSVRIVKKKTRSGKMVYAVYVLPVRK